MSERSLSLEYSSGSKRITQSKVIIAERLRNRCVSRTHQLLLSRMLARFDAASTQLRITHNCVISLIKSFIMPIVCLRVPRIITAQRHIASGSILPELIAPRGIASRVLARAALFSKNKTAVFNFGDHIAPAVPCYRHRRRFDASATFVTPTPRRSTLRRRSVAARCGQNVRVN